MSRPLSKAIKRLLGPLRLRFGLSSASTPFSLHSPLSIPSQFLLSLAPLAHSECAARSNAFAYRAMVQSPLPFFSFASIPSTVASQAHVYPYSDVSTRSYHVSVHCVFPSHFFYPNKFHSRCDFYEFVFSISAIGVGRVELPSRS